MVTGSVAFDTSMGYRERMFAGGQHVWGYTLVNAWAASLLLVACRPSRVATMLSWRPLVQIGRISYGMYVFHPAVHWAIGSLLGVQHGFKNVATFVVYFAGVVCISAASYRWFEGPILRLKDKRLPARSMPLSATGRL
jgi:peptidoglycan/LPS O-acetylase OafA/YrhL